MSHSARSEVPDKGTGQHPTTREIPGQPMVDPPLSPPRGTGATAAGQVSGATDSARCAARELTTVERVQRLRAEILNPVHSWLEPYPGHTDDVGALCDAVIYILGRLS